MAFRFAVENDLLVFTPEILMHQAYAQVYHYDLDAHHQNALRDLLWVQFMNEEDGAYSDYDTFDRLTAVNTQVYGIPDYTPESNRWHLRDIAAALYREVNETIEGQIIAMLNSQIMQLTRIIKQAGKDISGMSDTDVDTYLVRVNTQTENLNKLIANKTKIQEQIRKQGGKTRANNQGGAVTTPNEAGMMTREKIAQRMQLREQSRREEEQRKAAAKAAEEKRASEERDRQAQEFADREKAREESRVKKGRKPAATPDGLPEERTEPELA